MGKVNSPFDERRFKSLEGLVDYSIVNLSELDKIRRRLDAEFYQNYYLKLEEKINEIGKVYLRELDVKLDCSAFYPSITGYYNFDFEGVPFLRVNDIQNGLVTTTSDTAFLPKSVLDKNKGTIKIAYPGDIVIAKGGNTLAKLGLVTEQFPYFSLSRDLILVRTEGLDAINKYYLWVFLHSQYGQSLLWRTASQTGQPHLTLSSIEEIALPRYSNSFENAFEKMYKQSVALKNKSVETYQKAEERLLKTIGLNNFNLNEGSVNVKSFKDSFRTYGRIDAEYFQPKYDDIIKRIQTHNEWDTLGNQLEKIDTGEYSPEYFHKDEDDNLTFYIRSTNMKNGQIDIDDSYYVKKKDFFRKAKKGDIVTARVGSVGVFSEIREELEGAVYSDNVISFRMPDNYIPSVYTLLFNNDYYYELIVRLARGSVQQRLNQETLKKLIIPIIPLNEQELIATSIEESLQYRKKSNNLLEVAKRAVEIAIEQNESAAIDFINRSI